jgi:hypothetical protein
MLDNPQITIEKGVKSVTFDEIIILKHKFINVSGFQFTN